MAGTGFWPSTAYRYSGHPAIRNPYYSIQTASIHSREWHDILSKEHKNQMQWFDTFKPAETAKLRFLVESVSGNHEENDTPSIYEIEVYDTSEIK